MENNNISVSIIIPTYNRIPTLEKVLKAINRQTFYTQRIEIIVVDDFSPEPVKNIITKDVFNFNLSILHHDRNKGQGAARNTGICKAKGDIIILLDDDVIPDSRLVEEHLSFHKIYSEPEVAVSGKYTWAKDSTLTPIMYYMENGGNFTPFNRYKSHDILPVLLSGNISFKREYLLKNGLFDERFKEYGWEDAELGYRLMGKGLCIRYNEEAYGTHHKSIDTNSVADREYQCGKSALTFYNIYSEALPYVTNINNLLSTLNGVGDNNLLEDISKLEAAVPYDFPQNPKKIPKLWERYELLLKQNFFLGIFNRWKETNNDFEIAFDCCKKGIVSFNKKDWTSGIDSFNETITMLPNFYPAHWHIASALYHKGDNKRCEEKLLDMLTIFPNTIWPKYILGSILEKTGRLIESKKYFTEVVEDIDSRIVLNDMKRGALNHLKNINSKLDNLDLIKKHNELKTNLNN